MRTRTELSEKPPVFTCEKEENRAVITFYTDVAEAQRDESTVWTATAWTTVRPWADSLAQRIESNQDVWFNAIQKETYVQEDNAEETALQKQFSDTLSDTVLDLDYRITMLELINE